MNSVADLSVLSDFIIRYWVSYDKTLDVLIEVPALEVYFPSLECWYWWFWHFLRVCLLECSVREVRVVVASILEKTLESALQFGDPGLDSLTDALLSLLDKDVPENVKNCAQYFNLFSNFAQRVILQNWVFKYKPLNLMTVWFPECSLFFVHSLPPSLRVAVLVSCCWNTRRIAGCSSFCWAPIGRTTRYSLHNTHCVFHMFVILNVFTLTQLFHSLNYTQETKCKFFAYPTLSCSGNRLSRYSRHPSQ